MGRASMSGYVNGHVLGGYGVSYRGLGRVGVRWIRGKCECDREEGGSEDGACDWVDACEWGAWCVM